MLSQLPDHYDLIVVGGGITGAGIFHEAVRRGARVLLVEARDFGSGTSSWSSKLVHGGLRYLKEGQWRLTYESVRERQALLREAPGLVEPLTFLMPVRRHARPGRWTLRLGLGLYDLMAASWRSGWESAPALVHKLPGLQQQGLLGAVRYEDAQTDDARLVLRLILDAVSQGGQALNYVQASLLRNGDRVTGVMLCDAVDGRQREVHADVVINATGAWAGALPGAPQGAPALRPLRGSHLVFPARVLPLPAAVSWLHPRDGRPVFACPWETAVVLGTTDLDHREAPDDPRMNEAECQYLLEAVQAQFPGLSIQARDALSCYAGVRPVVAGGKADPSAESRESALWSSPGLIGITGGKLTTFRLTARQVLAVAASQVPALAAVTSRAGLFPSDGATGGRLSARLGAAAARWIASTPPEQQALLGDTPYCWAELQWSLAHERVVHLQDLMMRRTRLGLVSPDGGAAFLERIGQMCRATLGWDAPRWEQERLSYLAYWQRQHAVLDADRP